MKNYLLLFGLLLIGCITFAQSEESRIERTLKNYIEGSSYSNSRLIEKAFHKKANLYLEKKDQEVWIVPSQEYASWYKNEGNYTGRIGNILSIDFFNSIATAKAEIIMPSKNTRYIDMFLLKKIGEEWKILSKSASSEESNQTGDKILFIVSNASFHGKSKITTGNSYSEIVNAYDTFAKEGFTVDFVSPEGGSIPLAYINTSDSLHKKYLYDFDFMYALKNTHKPEEIKAKDYKAVHYIGGGSAMYGVPEDQAIQKITMEIFEEHNGIISSVCHGTAGLINLKTKDGNYVYAGKTVSGYPDAYEHKEAAYFKQFPFLIQETIELRGGSFNYSPRNTKHIEMEGNLITGQNYLSSSAVAQAIANKIKSQATID